jgi:hypothetical protein
MVRHFINPSTLQIQKKIKINSNRRSPQRQETETVVGRGVSSATR